MAEPDQPANQEDIDAMLRVAEESAAEAPPAGDAEQPAPGAEDSPLSDQGAGSAEATPDQGLAGQDDADALPRAAEETAVVDTSAVASPGHIGEPADGAGGIGQEDAGAAAPSQQAEAGPRRAAQEAALAAAEQLDLPDLGREPGDGKQVQGIDLLNDVNLHVKIELGRTQMTVEEVLRLARGAVVELDKLAGDPADVIVNDRLVARGEVLVLDGSFCVRVNEIIGAPSSAGVS